MSYQVLARKWRPRDFASLVGQEHVVRALTHALEGGRLHHAYLFTGTRGVGKTTLARILAKALNCERGVGATPCGVCSACTEIDAGRFVDLLEVDAATNTKVDEMRQLLENAVYAPTRGRYKVYVIDEVHMLSNSAFNAMLKTLEEPPEHVKFILATTDPQKIPVTVLSRCLQFNLKQMPQVSVVEHLLHVLREERIEAEAAALRLIARAGGGSMRDALSLLDQAIAHGAGSVTESNVRDMLGTVDTEQVLDILDALRDGDPARMMQYVDALAARSLSFDGALQELASVLVRIQTSQLAPRALGDEDPYRQRIGELAQSFDPEFVQLAYQIAIQGRQDLPLAPEPSCGFAMTMLRLFAFRPDSGPEWERKQGSGSTGDRTAAVAQRDVTVARGADSAPPARPPEQPQAAANEALSESLDWNALVQKLRISGMVRELAQHCELREALGGSISLRLAPAHRHLLGKPSQEKLQQILSDHLGRSIRLQIELDEPAGETPAFREQKERQSRQEHAVAAIESDGFVREIVDLFDAKLVESSIKPNQ